MSRQKQPNGDKRAGDILLGKRIRDIRKRLGLSQRAFGEKIGVSATAVGRYEKGSRYPSHRTLIAIADCGEVDLLWLTESTDIDWSGGSTFEQEALEHNMSIAKHLSTMPCVVSRTILRDYEGISRSKEVNDTIYFRGIEAFFARDSSLEPLAKKGQYVLTRPFAELLDGDLVIIITRQDKVLVGHVFQGQRKGTYELQDIDRTTPSPSIIIRSRDIQATFHIVGVVFERLGHRRGTKTE